MQKGWFDLFRENGGPTLYAHPNRTHGQYTCTVIIGFEMKPYIMFLVHGDASTIVLCIAFATLYVAFFVVFPGIRKEVSVKTADPYCAYSFMGRAIMLISSIMGLL